MDPADAAILPPTRRPTRRRSASVRAARILGRQLDWLHWPLVWWTPPTSPSPESTPTHPPQPNAPGAPPAHNVTALNLLTTRLRTRPRGAYAVRLTPAAPHLPAASGLDALLTTTAPTVTDVVPVDEALLARSLRRLMRAPRQFPRVLPAVVGDVGAWYDGAQAALKRIRPLIPPRKPTPAELLAIECAAVWMGRDDERPSRTLDATARVLRVFASSRFTPPSRVNKAAPRECI